MAHRHGTAVDAGLSRSVSTDSVSARDGFEWWTQMVGDAVMPVSITSDHADRFSGTATTLRLPRTDVAAFSFSPMSARRTPAHIRSADPEDYFLFLVHGSPVALEQRRNTTLLRAGDMALFSTSHPLGCEFQDHGRQTRVTLMKLPGAALPLPRDRADELVATGLPVRTGSGMLLATYLSGLRETVARCDATELQRLGAIGFDLAAAFLTAGFGSPQLLPAESRKQVLIARIHAFIDQNLPDPDLGPKSVAAYHHVSVRLLHALFRQEPETVGATIRRRRMERIRTDLTDPRLRHRGIGETALRWGFRHPADFSRSFRLAHGMSPSEFRQTALPPGTGS